MSVTSYIWKYYEGLRRLTVPLDTKLCDHTKQPKALCDPGILHGYRPTNRPWSYYLLSIFQLHNETLNIWTHLIGLFVLVYFLIYYKSFYHWNDKDWWPFFIFGISCMITHLFSAAAHCLHSKSERIHHLVFCLDYAGVSTAGFGTGIAAFYSVPDEDAHRLLSSVFLTAYTLSSWGVFMALCCARLIWKEGNLKDCQKRKCLQLSSVSVQGVLLGLSFFPRYFKCFVDDTCSISSLNHITYPMITIIITAFLYGAHLPETKYPGKFDIVGQSHQIFHITITITHLLQMRAIHLDIQNQVPHFVETPAVTLFGAWIIFLLMQLTSLVFLRRYVSDSETKCE